MLNQIGIRIGYLKSVGLVVSGSVVETWKVISVLAEFISRSHPYFRESTVFSKETLSRVRPIFRFQKTQLQTAKVNRSRTIQQTRHHLHLSCHINTFLTLKASSSVSIQHVN